LLAKLLQQQVFYKTSRSKAGIVYQYIQAPIIAVELRDEFRDAFEFRDVQLANVNAVGDAGSRCGLVQALAPS
jgi:hypothetical protein